VFVLVLIAPDPPINILAPGPIVRVPSIIQLPTKVTVQATPTPDVPIPKLFGHRLPLLVSVTEVFVLVLIAPDPPISILAPRVTEAAVAAVLLPTSMLLVMVIVFV
jgi:hypothetical protein